MEISTKKISVLNQLSILVLKLISRLSFLSLFTAGKKCIEFPLASNFLEGPESQPLIFDFEKLMWPDMSLIQSHYFKIPLHSALGT